MDGYHKKIAKSLELIRYMLQFERGIFETNIPWRSYLIKLKRPFLIFNKFRESNFKSLL